MGTKADFKVKKHAPFIIEGSKATYTIPPLEQLPFDAVKEVASLTEDATAETQVRAFTEFFNNLAPGLEDEGYGAVVYLNMGKAYFEKMGE